MTTDTFPLPSTYAYGKVVGRIIYAIGDTAGLMRQAFHIRPREVTT